MSIELSQHTKALLEKQVRRYGFASPDEAIEQAFEVFEAHRPTEDSLNALLREAHREVQAGDVATLDGDDIKRRGRQRLSGRREG